MQYYCNKVRNFGGIKGREISGRDIISHFSHPFIMIYISFNGLAAYTLALMVLDNAHFYHFNINGPPQTLVVDTMPICCAIVYMLTSHGITCYITVVNAPNGVVNPFG